MFGEKLGRRGRGITCLRLLRCAEVAHTGRRTMIHSKKSEAGSQRPIPRTNSWMMPQSLFIPGMFAIGVSMLRMEERSNSLLIGPLPRVFHPL